MNSGSNTKVKSLMMRDLELAAMDFEKRNYFIHRALTKYVYLENLQAIAYIRFSPLFTKGYETVYVGREKELFDQHIQPFIRNNIQDTMLNLTDSNKQFIKQAKLTKDQNSIIFTWPSNIKTHHKALEELLLAGLQAISYTEAKEHDYFYDIGTPFDKETARAIQAKDHDGLVELLSLTKQMTNSDITFWGDTNSKQVAVDMHIGSYHDDFSFLLPVGKGIGGLVAESKSVLQVSDYKNCPYRYKDVSPEVDREDIRTVFALPLKDKEQNTSGVLYIGNRTVNPLPLEKKFLLLRLGYQLEPLIKRKEIRHFFTPRDKDLFFQSKKAELREIGQTATDFKEVEIWLSKLVKGEVIYFDEDHLPYKQTKALPKEAAAYTFPINYRDRHLGSLKIWTEISLPLPNWPDLLEDITHTLLLVHERNERYYHLAELKRSQWIYNMLQKNMNVNIQYEKGVKLHIPVDQGELWAFHIQVEEERLSLNQKMKLDDIVLKHFRKPIYFSGTTGYILFDRKPTCTAEELRNELLSVLPKETWLVHGATYSTFKQLHTVLIQVKSLLKKSVLKNNDEYVITFERFGLDNLLNNPEVSDNLVNFAERILEPVLQYDKENQTELTITLTLSLVYHSPSKVARQLYIHPNTVHYRVNRAKELLNINLNHVKNELTLTFASYIWLFEQQIDIN